MTTATEDELDKQIEDAIKDGISNHTGEWFNGFICPGLNLSEQQSQDLLFDLVKAKRLKHNIQALIDSKVNEAYKKGYVDCGIEQLKSQQTKEVSE